MVLSTTIPVLRIFDEAKAREFYIDFLGFTETFHHAFGDNFPIYIGIKSGDCLIHLSEHHGDGSPGANIRIHCDDFSAFAKTLQAKDYRFAKPGTPQEQPWGMKELSVTDPFGNRLCFFEET